MITNPTPNQCEPIGDTVKSVRKFVSDFKKVFDKAPIEERKILIGKCISEIVVDRDKKVARFFVRRIPVASPQLEELLQNKRVPTEVVSTRSSGDTLQCAPTKTSSIFIVVGELSI